MFDLGNAYKNQLIDANAENKYYSAKIDIDIKDKNNTKVIITDYIKKNSRCLDVGCGVGYLGELLYKHKNAEVYGVDLDKEALRYAAKKKCFKDLYNFSITDLKGKEFERFIDSKLKFDYIVFADVVEHVVDSEGLLLFFSKFLSPGGKIIISLPNVAHFDIVRGLVDAKFNYNHIGLLDNTHLRFYTKSSFREFIEQINEVRNQKFALKEIGKTIAEPDYLVNYPSMYKLLNKNKEACVLQYVWELSIGTKMAASKREEKHTFDELEMSLGEALKNKTENERLRERVAELEKAIDKIYKSKSWLVTKPVRGASLIVKKIRKK